MPRSICIIHGHPDPTPGHFTAALADAYGEAATEAGHEVARIDIAQIELSPLRRPEDILTEPDDAIKAVQAKMMAAQHVVVVFPLWMGGMPSYLRAFFEQVSRGGFVLDTESKGWPKGKLSGRSARVVVTMGMPAAAYRMFFGAHGVRGFERSVLALAGFKPIRETLFGLVDMSAESRQNMLAKMRRLGAIGK